MNSDITEQYLNKMYEDLHREQMILMNSMKTASSENEKEKGISKQISQINTLMLGCLRLRNLRKQFSSNSI
jgi:predicted aldo/keto reductase-like oxidoreductase